MGEKPYYLQIGYRGASIALRIIGNVTPETLRYLARFALFQAETMEERPDAGAIEYASWFPPSPHEVPAPEGKQQEQPR